MALIAHEQSQGDDHSLPTTKRAVGTFITRIGHLLISRRRRDLRLARRIAKYKKKAAELEEERKELNAACKEELAPLADDVADFSMLSWDEIHEPGTRTVRYGTGEVRLRNVGRPVISVKDNDVAAFFREVRRKRLATRLIRVIEEPNIDALHDDIELAFRLRTVSVAYTTKLEIRPTHSDDRLEASVTEDEWEWDIVSPKAKKPA